MDSGTVILILDVLESQEQFILHEPNQSHTQTMTDIEAPISLANKPFALETTQAADKTGKHCLFCFYYK